MAVYGSKKGTKTMNKNRPPQDLIRFRDTIGIRSKRCTYEKTESGFVHALIDNKRYMIPRTSILVIIRNVDRSG